MSPVLRPSLFTSLSHPTRTLRLSSAFDIGQTTATTVAQQTLKKKRGNNYFPPGIGVLVWCISRTLCFYCDGRPHPFFSGHRLFIIMSTRNNVPSAGRDGGDVIRSSSAKREQSSGVATRSSRKHFLFSGENSWATSADSLSHIAFRPAEQSSIGST